MTRFTLSASLLLASSLLVGCVGEPLPVDDAKQPPPAAEPVAEDSDSLIFRVTDALTDEPIEGITFCVEEVDDSRCATTTAWGWIEIPAEDGERLSLVSEATDVYRAHAIFIGAARDGYSFDLPLVSDDVLLAANGEDADLDAMSFIVGMARDGELGETVADATVELGEGQSEQMYYSTAGGALTAEREGTSERGLYLFCDVVPEESSALGFQLDVAVVEAADAAGACQPAATLVGMDPAQNVVPLREGVVSVAPTMYCGG
jgi:hypothetical protein